MDRPARWPIKNKSIHPMNTTITETAKSVLAQIKQMTGRDYVSVSFKFTENRGEVTPEISVYADQHNHHSGKTLKEALDSMRGSLGTDLLREAQGLEAQAAELRERASRFSLSVSISADTRPLVDVLADIAHRKPTEALSAQPASA